MAIEIARYQFLSWARKGISAAISDLDTLGAASAAVPAGERASVPVGVSINAAPQPAKPFALIGPGDIIGVHRDMIVRTEPHNWITNFEPNYLAFVEFYDEDFPWRYTPARPDGERLRPWLLLLVLEDGEYERDDRRLPLPVVTVKRKEALPPSDETWLFAHVHAEQDIGAGDLSSVEQYLISLEAEITTDPDKLYSRLMAPRHLAPNRSYNAFLVPAFEAGRLAGLGRSTVGVPGQKPAWTAETASIELPFYYDWSFRTGEKADFESLVKLLQPRVLDPRIGVRSMDCSKPGFVRVDDKGRERAPLPGEEQGLPAPEPAIQGLEGALRTDRTKSAPETFAANAFQTELAILVNMPETIVAVEAPAGSDEEFLNDPVVTVPFYGQNHARRHKADKVLLDVSNDGWLNELNRDPRTRASAGFGVAVIKKHQERFMQSAWRQLQKIHDANRVVRQFQFLVQVSTRYSAQFFAKLSPADLIAVTQPIHAKVMGSPTTIRHQLRNSRLRAPVFGAPFRRMMRPGGRVARHLDGAQGANFPALVTALNEGRVAPAPPRVTPKDIPAVEDLANAIQPWPDWLDGIIERRNLALALVLVAALALGLFAGLWIGAIALAAAAIAGFIVLSRQAPLSSAARALTDPAEAVKALATTPPQPDFAVVLDSDDSRAQAAAVSSAAAARTAGPAPGPGATSASAAAPLDSPDARNFRAAATAFQARIQVRVPEVPPPAAFDIANGAAKLAHAIDPRVSFPNRLKGLVALPGLPLEQPEEFVDAMAYPDIEDAMYAPLRDINKELLIPNLNLIPPNTISLLETNPRFIEAYMVGLNHEMGRELLWREYPTDMRGSYFRQFWEVKGVSNPDTPGDAEQLKDITKIHRWPKASRLGAHRPSPPANADVGPGEKQVVLVMRGDLLKRYPNTVIYAQKAIAGAGGTNVLRTTDLTSDQFDKELKFPLFRAEIDPDLRFFGFDLTIAQAKGEADSRNFPGDKRGWFFVIQEVPGEPRFGMDIAYAPTTNATPDTSDDPRDTFDNLAWDRFGSAEPPFVPRAPAPAFPRSDNAELAAHPWGSSAAQMAYALYQDPVMVAVHAREMLELADA